MSAARVVPRGRISAGVVAGIVAARPRCAESGRRGEADQGHHGADKIKGTKKKDRIKAKGGNDRVNARKGKDKLAGGSGNDFLKGGKGKDAHKGGAGNDFLNAVDRRADKSVAGGPGNDTCRIDIADLPVTTGCETREVVGGGPDGGGGPGGPGAGLTVTSGSGLSYASQLPTCLFQIEGAGADSLLGTVTGGGGVSLAAGVGVSIQPDGSWTVAGLYGCTDDGFLRVTIGSESVDVPVTCST